MIYVTTPMARQLGADVLAKLANAVGSPGVVAMCLDVSIRTARRLIDEDVISSVGRGKHRWVQLSQLINNKNGKGTHRHDQGTRPRAAD